MNWPGRDTSLPRLARAALVVGLTTFYFWTVFGFSHPTAIATNGVGPWGDPYLINYVMENWWHSLRHFSNPASPPMFYPAPSTLGYSVGLILYAPFYVAVRPFLHPFQAYNATLFLVMQTGVLSLYVILRRFIRVSLVEALIVVAFFATSANITNGPLEIWSQTASVFLVPSILLIGLHTRTMPQGRSRLLVTGLCGLLTALLLTQDIYTALFTLLLAAAAWTGVLFLPSSRRLIERIQNFWRANKADLLAFGCGAVVGGAVFVWVYYRSYLEHQGFLREVLLTSLNKQEPGDWHSIRDVLHAFDRYDSMRAFIFIYAAGLLALVPWLNRNVAIRRYAIWFMAVTFVVMLIPLRIHKWSLWVDVFSPLPGFSAIRDPKRVIYVFELLVALVAAMFLASLPRRSPLRIGTALLMTSLLVTFWNPYVFEFGRANRTFDTWVAAPIQIDPSCRSFFSQGASTDYSSRYGHIWSLYGVDAMFIALRHGIPTLNGYSAWTPPEWALTNPGTEGYQAAVDSWIQLNHLQHVCALDLEKRTMTPYEPTAKR